MICFPKFTLKRVLISVGEVSVCSVSREPQQAHFEMGCPKHTSATMAFSQSPVLSLTHQTPRRLTLFSGEHRHKGLTHAPLFGILRGGNRSLAQSLGQTPQHLEAPNNSPQRRHKGLGQSPQQIGEPKYTTCHKGLTCLFISMNLRGKLHQCTKCNGKNFTLKFHQSYKSYWGNKRGRTKETTNVSKI